MIEEQDSVNPLEHSKAKSITITRRDFLGIAGAVAATIGLKAVSDRITPPILCDVVSKQIKEFEQKTESSVAPVSSVLPDSHGMRGLILTENKIPADTLFQDIDKANVKAEVEPFTYYRRSALFTSTTSPTSLRLELGIHGNLDSHTTIPITFPSQDIKIDKLAMDSLLNSVFFATPEQRTNMLAKVKEAAQTATSDEVRSLPIELSDIEIQKLTPHIVKRFYWAPLYNLDKQPEMVSTDISTAETEWAALLYGLENLNPLYQQFQKAVNTSDVAAATLAIQALIDIVGKNIPINKPQATIDEPRKINRKEFLQFWKWGSKIAEGGLTAAAVFETGKLALSHRDIFQRIERFYKENPVPAENTPAGFRGVIEYLLDKNPSDLSFWSISELGRDLISSYKTTVLQRQSQDNTTNYAIWGALHSGQIGLLELSPEQILEYIKRFKAKFGQQFFHSFQDFPPSAIQLCTATGYQYELDKQYNRNGVPDTKVVGVRQFVFPALYKEFQEQIDRIY